MGPQGEEIDAELNRCTRALGHERNWSAGCKGEYISSGHPKENATSIEQLYGPDAAPPSLAGLDVGYVLELTRAVTD